jgi:predicted ATPase/signal transduction histidine kinase/tRNA A-37 threonylcarbamoyl transferase component Bud32
MFELANYTITEKIYEGLKTAVYRGYHNEKQTPVIIKASQSQHPDAKLIAQFHHEYEIAHGLDLPGIIKPLALQQYHHTWALIFEDIQGEALKTVLEQYQTLPPFGNESEGGISTFLLMALQLSETLAGLHFHGIIHKDIKPANIIVNLAMGQIKLTDFSISSRLSLEHQTISNPHLLEGTLLYMSPEQTGRMNRAIDYRTDFYSLGAVFYEMLVGHPPFNSDDVMELVHGHLAKQPPPPHLINAQVPPALSAIVMKLLAKTAEARYQSAYGLKADLQKSWQQLKTTGYIEPFEYGQQDISDKFQIPQKLYGRDPEIALLLECFERATTPGTDSESVEHTAEVLLVSGYSGIGKSMLVKEIYKPITPQRGYFSAGKFDQFQRNVPYSALVGAFTDLIRQLLTENEDRLVYWREQLLAAVGKRGQVIIDVIPEVELIIGPQPAIPTLIPIEAQNRFNEVLQNFLRVFCQPEHPLVLFLDDLQWVDAASLKLIELITTVNPPPYLFLVGAYRDNEVSATHPLMMTLETLSKAKVHITPITLTPLALSDVTQLLADTVSKSPAEVQTLAELVVAKTNGNPFFVNQFLKTLYQEQLLTFSPPQAEHLGGWQWDVQQIEAKGITDNVVDLMVGKLRQLPSATQQVLRLAACVGNRFDLLTLAVIHEQSISQTHQALLASVEEGLILPTSGLEAVKGEAEEQEEKNAQSLFLILHYQFLHDRVQQAAYALIDDDQKQAVHFTIGQRLQAELSEQPAQLAERLFEVVDHLNRGLALLTTVTEQVGLVQLNLAAAQKAKNATAYVAAWQYLTTALNFLKQPEFETQLWEQHYDLTLALHKESAEVAYLNGYFEQSETIIHHTVSRAKTPIEKADVYHILIVQYTLRAEYVKAIETGRQALALLDIQLPEENFERFRNQEMQQVKATIGDKSIASLFDLPVMSQLKQQTAVKLLITMGPPCYRFHQRLWAVIVPKVINLCLTYGNVPQIGYSHTAFGGLVGYVWNEYDWCEQFGQLATRLMTETFLNPSDQSVFYLMIGSSVRHWSKHLKYASQDYQQAYQIGLEGGNLQYAAYAFGHNMYCRFYQGINLTELYQEVDGYLAFSRTRKNQWAIDLLEGGQRVMMTLNGMNKGEFDKDQVSEAEYLQRCETNKNIQVLCIYHILKTQALYLLGHLSPAMESFVEAEQRIIAVATQGLLPTAEHCLYHALLLAARYPQATPAQQTQYWSQLEANQEQMKIWATHCPANFQPQYSLITAEMARLSGDVLSAINLYDQAIELALDGDFIQIAALANELAAHFWLQQGKAKIAQIYLSDALYNYTLWGAKTKVKKLLEAYPQWLGKTETNTLPHDLGMTVTRTLTSRQLSTSPTFTSTMSLAVQQSLDVMTVLKASHAISQEMVHERLLKKLMSIVIENVGAEQGWLMLNKKRQETTPKNKEVDTSAVELVVEAQGTVEEVKIFEAIPLELVDNHGLIFGLSKSIVSYVARTQEPLVLSDASHAELFANDPYIVQHQPLSVLCFPMIYQNQLMGIFYLENNLTSNVFTPDRLAVLKMLSAQIAISLENAKTMATLDTKVKIRTAELNAKVEELTQTRHELVQSEKMASLGRMVAGFAHEINTPIGVAVGASSTLQGYTGDINRLLEQEEVDEEELVSILESIEEASELTLSNLKRAANLINSFKRTAVDQSSETMRIFSVPELIQDIINNLQGKLKHTSIKIQVDCPQELKIYSLPGALEQILTNFIINSLYHGFEGGQLGGEINIQANEQDTHFYLTYTDTGKGITPEIKEKIFEPFFTTQRAHGGSGLGLYICYNIITSQLHGHITCDSEPGQGVKFTVDYPLHPL